MEDNFQNMNSQISRGDPAIWGNNIHRMLTKHLASMLRRYQKYLEHKESVIAKHQAGTSYHTRASREAAGARERIAIIENELKRRT